jgi:hypothetical protein
VISAERKKFGMVPRKFVRVPNPLLNNVVLLKEDGKARTCSIGFSGQKLPRGLAKFDPAYLIVTEKPGRGWLVQAAYFRDDTAVDLWLAKERPTWLKSFNNERG